VTIAIQLSGAYTLLTAADTQETYGSGEKVDSGKIISFSRAKPLGNVSITGAGDSQEISRMFQKFDGSFNELEAKMRETARLFYENHVMPFVGKLEDDNVPDYSLLVAATHEDSERLWCVERTMITDSALYERIGSGKPAADALLNRRYPRYPTLDSLAILAAYVIYKVKSTVDGCGSLIFEARKYVLKMDSSASVEQSICGLSPVHALQLCWPRCTSVRSHSDPQCGDPSFRSRASRRSRLAMRRAGR
jgi:hypothetical protein